MIELRDYQQNILDRMYQSFLAGHRRPLVQSSCGSGKTVIFTKLAELTQAKGNSVIVLVHRRELLKQTIDTFSFAGVDLDRISVHMAQTYSRHLSEHSKPDLIITDEAHMAAAKTWRRIYEHWPDAYMVGFSASPCRLDGKPLGNIFDDLIVGIDTAELIERGWLSSYRLFSVASADLKNIKQKGRDFDMEDAERALMKRAVYGNVIAHHQKLAKDLRTVIYCTTVEHSKKTAEAFREAGYPSEHIDGTFSEKQRDEIVERFRTGETQVLTNCDIVSTGFDLPAIGCCIMLRPTMSTALYIQQSGRALRPAEGKTAIILDHVGNAVRHGLPDDPRGWSLTDTVKPKPKFDEEGKLILRTCTECFAVYPNTESECPLCGEPYQTTREEIEQINSVQLVELKRKQEAHYENWQDKKAETLESESDCKTYAELIALGKKKGEPNLKKYATKWSYQLGISRPWDRRRG